MNTILSPCVKRSDNNNDILTRCHRDSVIVWEKNQALFSMVKKCMKLSNMLWSWTATGSDKCRHTIRRRIPRYQMWLSGVIPNRRIVWIILCIGKIGIYTSHSWPEMGCFEQLNNISCKTWVKAIKCIPWVGSICCLFDLFERLNDWYESTVLVLDTEIFVWVWLYIETDNHFPSMFPAEVCDDAGFFYRWDELIEEWSFSLWKNRIETFCDNTRVILLRSLNRIMGTAIRWCTYPMEIDNWLNTRMNSFKCRQYASLMTKYHLYHLLEFWSHGLRFFSKT